VDVCEDSFAPGRWWHYTSVTDYFACVDERMSHCDYYEIDRACSPMYSDVIYALQLVSLCCSLLVLVRLAKELKKGLFQLLFISVVHNVCQSIVTEQGYEVWAWYLLPKVISSPLPLPFLVRKTCVLSHSSLLFPFLDSLVTLHLSKNTLLFRAKRMRWW